MAAHELAIGTSDKYYTPKHVFAAMGAAFDLDVAHPGLRKWPAWSGAPVVFNNRSLERDWFGFVWMNPPFGARNGLDPWMDKFMAHGNGVALTPDRTSAPWWQKHADHADLVLFVREKIKFHKPDGRQARQPGTGTTLWAKGELGIAALLRAESAGLGRNFSRKIAA